MGEPFRLRRPTKRETAAGGLFVAAGAAFLASREPQSSDHPVSPTVRTEHHNSEPTAASTPRGREQSPDTPSTIDHETYRQEIADQVLEHLLGIDPNFSITTTVSVNGAPVTDKFFGINYKMPDGNSAPLGMVYPDETTGQLHFSPDEDMSLWVQRTTGEELNGYSASTPEALTDAAMDMLELADLHQSEKNGTTVSTSHIAEQLVANETITTEAAREEQKELRASKDTGD